MCSFAWLCAAVSTNLYNTLPLYIISLVRYSFAWLSLCSCKYKSVLYTRSVHIVSLIKCIVLFGCVCVKLVVQNCIIHALLIISLINCIGQRCSLCAAVSTDLHNTRSPYNLRQKIDKTETRISASVLKQDPNI